MIRLPLATHTHDCFRYVDFALGRLHMLQHFGIIPYVVFDGDNLPGKAATEEERAAKRASHRATGLALLDSGRTKDAHREFQGAVDVTPSMARAFIDELRRLDIKYVVAPYEADAQLVYLESQGMVDAILSEDSDLLVFGAKRLISKLDKHGDCIELSRADFGDCKDINMVGWTDAEFRAMCILSGCDYLKSMHRMGLKSAYTSLRKHKRVERVVQMWQFENRTVVPPGYLHEFRRADATFLYQRVFCPKAREVVTLHPTPADVDPGTLVLIGDHIEPAVAQGVASGDLHPMTKQALNPYPASPSRGPQGRQWQPARRSTLPAATSKGSMVPISRLFTPKRTPLATLDPNSLTPTDSQRDLLRGNAGRSWSANAVLPNRTMCPDSAPITPLNLRQALAVESDAVTGKRLRDVGAAPDEGDVGDDTPSKSHVDRTGRSRFFSNSRGPVRPVARQKRPKIDIWEDGPVAGNGHSLGGADTTVAGDQGGSRDGPVDTPRMNSGEQQEHAAECAVVTPT
ncbi:Rad2 nuclease, partial [Ascosphaera acerosa]